MSAEKYWRRLRSQEVGDGETVYGATLSTPESSVCIKDEELASIVFYCLAKPAHITFTEKCRGVHC